MPNELIRLPIGQQVSLPSHFDIPVVLEAARPLAKGFECRVRLPDGTLDEAVYLKMLPQPRLRFLLADDPGAGKTIMAGLTRGTTTFIIAHRLSTIPRADRIIVLKDGQIAESGTHAELLAQRGIYLRFHELQSGSSSTTVATKSE